jgi:hypothetical protein
MSKSFNYDKDFALIDVRKHPELYQVGKGEQGVLSFEPYKSELLPHWRFKTPAIAEKSAKEIFKMFNAYKKQDDFVGMDMARKFLMMGYTRSRRYANHKSGRKYADKDKETPPKTIPPTPPYKDERNRQHHIKSRMKEVLPLDPDPEKARSAEIFKKYYEQAKTDRIYQLLKQEHKEKFG